ncbi:MAG: type II toxin-antitoxin system VapC family toxin [bacterium]
MTMMFWDASAIIPLCVTEKYSNIMKKLLTEDPLMAVWWGTPLECYSTFARLLRDCIINSQEEQKAKKPLDKLTDIWTEINPSYDIRDQAIRLISVHPLKAADSLQLAAAIIWSGKSPKDYHFVCLDKKLREAALKEGFTIVPLNIE